MTGLQNAYDDLAWEFNRLFFGGPFGPNYADLLIALSSGKDHHVRDHFANWLTLLPIQPHVPFPAAPTASLP